jgi:hypothetical protein
MEADDEQMRAFRRQQNILKYSCVGVSVIALLIGIDAFHIIGLLGVIVETAFVSLVASLWYIHGKIKLRLAATNYRNKKK